MGNTTYLAMIVRNFDGEFYISVRGDLVPGDDGFAVWKRFPFTEKALKILYKSILIQEEVQRAKKSKGTTGNVGRRAKKVGRTSRRRAA